MIDDRTGRLAELLTHRIAVLDGAAGTMLRPFAPAGPVDDLNLRRPGIVSDLHRAYLAAGADIVKTNTFNATPLDGWDLDTAKRINRRGAEIARAAVDAAERDDPARPRFVAGVLGPTHRSASVRSDAAHPDPRAVAFDVLRDAYAVSARSLLEGGADLLLIETLVDIRNAEAALQAAQNVFREMGAAIPLIISATVTERGERTLSGQTMAEFWASLAPAAPLAVGLNCAFGAAALGPALRSLAAAAPIPVSVHPNAGLPDPAGAYGDGPEILAAALREFVDDGIVNMVGGCCGTTPAHIAAIAAALRGCAPRR